ncbi:hypothetical protein B0H10DRAFT_2225213 [Mycena sp. CBHHK59/15]|nr:hypothetical protein B0H10DRAFT_2225213 [Mycena sp. CBHHK59/15]
MSNKVPPSNSKASVQSAIWSMDMKTKELKARYAAADGAKSPLRVAFDSLENELYFVDIGGQASVNADLPASAVRLFLSED